MAVLDIARREIFVSGVFKHAALEHIDSGSRKPLVQGFEETDVFLNVRK